MYSGNNPLKWFDPDGLKPTLKEAALIANDVYNDISKAYLAGGWRRVNIQSEIALNQSSSGFKSAIYGRWDAKRKKYTEYVYATAGTDFTSLNDWQNNIEQLLGTSEQYNLSVDNAKQIDQYFINSELTFVGHSLGGGLASANSLSTGRDAITFNAAGLSNATKKNLNLNSRGTIDAYVVSGEALNIVQQMIGMKAEGNIHKLKVPSILDAAVFMLHNNLGNVLWSSWKHTMNCVNYILK